MHVLLMPSWYPSTKEDISGCFFREQAHALCGTCDRVGVLATQMVALRRVTKRFSRIELSDCCDEGVATVQGRALAWIPGKPKTSANIEAHLAKKLWRRYVARYGRPDIIHAHALLNGGVSASRISKELAIPYVVTEHYTGYARGMVTGPRLQLAREAARLAAVRFAVSKELARTLQHRLGTEAGCWEFLPNMVDNQFFRRSLSIRDEKNEFQFCNVALLTKKKGVHILLEAFSKAFGNHPSVVLTIVGDGPELPALTNLAEQLGIANRVTFAGQLPRREVVERLARSDAFVLSSLHETFGVVLIEALALGKPVVATRCGGPESIVEPGDGILVDPDSVEELARGMKELWNSSGQYDAGALRDSCRRRFSASCLAERLCTTYQSALA